MRRFASAIAVVGVLVAASAAIAAGSEWSIQHPPNPKGSSDSELHGVACTSQSACNAVGWYFNGTTDVTLAERWNGTKWSLQHPPNPKGGTQDELGGVSCTSQSACIAVGRYNDGTTYRTLAERWNGAKWSLQHPPNPKGSSDSELHGVSCASKSACTAVGVYNNGSKSVTLAERWTGTKWSILHTPNPKGGSENSLNGVFCASTSACTAVGSYNNGKNQVTLAERWNGAKWSLQHPPNPGIDSLNGVSCASPSACTAVGGDHFGGTLAERWNGKKWSIETTPNATGSFSDQLLGVSCTSSSACTAVGNYDTLGGNRILAERWNGKKWSIQHPPNPKKGTDNSLNGVSCGSQSACTAVGDYNNGTKTVTLAERWKGP